MAKEHKKISAEMSDDERFKILKNRKLAVAISDPNKIEAAAAGALDELKELSRMDAKPILDKLVDEFGVLKSYENKDINLVFAFSGKNRDESIRKQGDRYDHFALLLSCFDDVIKNAVGMEVHHDRYGDHKNLKNMYVLASAFEHNGLIVPVKLEVKELNTNNPNALYVAVSRSPFKIKKATVLARPNATVVASALPRVASTISIRQMFRKINSLDGDFLKYVPKPFLNRAQNEAAREAKTAEEQYIKRKMDERKPAPRDEVAPKTVPPGEAAQLPKKDESHRYIKPKLTPEQEAQRAEKGKRLKQTSSRVPAPSTSSAAPKVSDKTLNKAKTKKPAKRKKP